MRAPLAVAVTIAIGLVVLLGYFLPFEQLTSLRIVLLDWAVILAAVALLVGIGNLITVHGRKSAQAPGENGQSIVLLGALFLTLGVTGWFGPTHSYSLWIFNNIQVPIESSLLAILAALLVYALVRLLRRRMDRFALVFVATVVIVLLATAPLLGFDVPILGDLRSWLAEVPAVGGARGILLGIALGIIATGVRILIGADRPYGG